MNTTIKRQITYWKTSARHNWETAQDLFKLKRYDACLFFCHLAIEKILKGIVVKKTGKSAPFIHDLVFLADRAKIEISDDQRKDLGEITTFNISGRYDNEKLSFYKRCTKPYTEKYLQRTKQFYLWLEKEFRNA